MQPYFDIDAETLRRLYLEDRLPMTEVAKRLGCSSVTVARRLRLHDIASRPRGTIPLHRTISAPQSGWSADLAWAIGLIATDGNLSPDGRHLMVRSKDRDMLETLRRCLGLTNRITATSNGRGGHYHTLQWSDRAFYLWLMDVGLTPAKSLTLAALSIPTSISRTSSEDASTVMAPFACTRIGTMPRNANATSTNACMYRSCRRVEHSSTGSRQRCHDSRV